MTEPEDLVRSTTRAIAGTVRDVPPLRLTPAQDDVLSFAPVARRARRLRGWLAPVTAAAVVLAVAASLVIIRDIPNGRVVPAASPASSASVPAYYVALSAPATAARNDLVVGDTFTGSRLATVQSPKGTVFGVVTAAADDRTFIVDVLPTSGRVRYATWYLLRISPGASSPARLTRLPIPAIPVGLIGAAAVSESGSELAVMLQPFQQMLHAPASMTALRIYSVGTGRLLRGWSTTYQHIAAGVSPSATLNDSLSWVDGDRAVAFDTYRYVTTTQSTGAFATTVRVIDVAAGGSNLILDSRAVTSGCPGPPSAQVPPLTPNGQTVLCVRVAGSVSRTGPGLGRWTVQPTWSAHPASASTALRTLFKVTVHSVAGGGITDAIGVQWTDASAAAMIVYWGVGPLTGPLKVHFGVASQGRFVSLPTPLAGLAGLDNLSEIAW